jgi:hypothetical protein
VNPRKGCGERDAVLVPTQHAEARSAVFALRLGPFSHRFPFHLNAVRVVDQPGENAVCQRGVADLFMPSADGQLRSQNRGTALVTLFTDFPEVPPFGFSHRRHRPIVDDHHIDASKPRQQMSQTAIGPRETQIAEHRLRRGVEYRVTIAARCQRSKA